MKCEHYRAVSKLELAPIFTLCMMGNFSSFFVVYRFFSKLNFFKKLFQEYYQGVSLDLDPARHSVGPDLGPNCLQSLSAEDKICRYKGKS